MDLTEEQRALRDAVRSLLARHESGSSGTDSGSASGPEGGPGSGSQGRSGSWPEGGSADWPEGGSGIGPSAWQPSAWQRLCTDIGVAGLAIPEVYGGAGAGPLETHVVAEELGRCLTPSPLVGSAVLAAQALLASGDADVCARLLPGVAGGTITAALAWAGEAGHWHPADVACRATPVPGPPASPTKHPASVPAERVRSGHCSRGTGWEVTGTAHYVLDGDRADVLLAAARTPEEVALFEVDPKCSAVRRWHVTSMDPALRLAVVEFAGAPARRVAGCGTAALARARDLACIALSAEQVGAARRALELTVSYTSTRVQFGRPIATFQALAHRMADLHVLVDSARALSYAAASAAADGADDLSMRAAAAKVCCSDALSQVAAEMIQLHGAIGITWEHPAHRYFKHAHATSHLFGQPSEHLARIATELVG